ncbi:hypothetical protein [Halocola ammonii]
MLRILLLLLFPVVTLSSCTNYQYVSLTSDVPAEEGTDHYLIQENDVKVTIEIGGRDMLVTTRIYNQSSQDLFVDLSSSVFTQNNKVKGNLHGDAKIDLVTNSSSIDFDDFESSTGRARGRITRDPSIAYIPPGAYLEVRRRPFTVWFRSEKFTYHGKRRVWGEGGVMYNAVVEPLGYEAMTFGVHLRIARSQDFSDVWGIEANFKEYELYSSVSALPYLPEESPGSYVTIEKTGKGLPAVLLLTGLTVLIISADGDDDSDDGQ